MLKKVYVTIFAIVILSGMVYLVSLAIKGKSIPKIKPSYFKDTQEVAESIQHRLRQELKDSPVLFFGVMPGDKFELEVAEKFSQLSDAPEFAYDQIMYDLTIVNDPKRAFDSMENYDLFVETLKNSIAAKKRVMVILPSYFASYSAADNLVHKIKKDLNLPPISISIVNYPDTREEENNVTLACHTNADKDLTGTGSLGCLIFYKARMMYNKKLDTSRIRGAMDQFGEEDYLMFLNPPK